MKKMAKASVQDPDLHWEYGCGSWRAKTTHKNVKKKLRNLMFLKCWMDVFYSVLKAFPVDWTSIM